jgi:hypothetical protein
VPIQVDYLHFALLNAFDTIALAGWGHYSTVEDLYRWNEAIFNDRVLDTASLDAAFTPVKVDDESPFFQRFGNGYGFGWFIGRFGRDLGLRMIWHNGGLPGFCSCLLRVPSKKFTVAVLAGAWNGRPNADAQDLAYQLVNIYMADQFAPLPIVNTNVSPNSYDALTGRYDLIGKIMTISKSGAHLFEQYTGYPKEEIFPESDTDFFAKGVPPITFVKDGSGKAVKLILHQDGADLDALRAKDITGVNVDLAVYDSLAGKYDFGNGTVLTVTREGNHLFAQVTGRQKFEIFPTSETEYFSRWRMRRSPL